jgi:catalase (peroxidase I)
MLDLFDDDFDNDLQLLALQSLLNSRRSERAIAVRDYQEQLEHQEFLNEYPEAAGMFDRMAAIETQAYRTAMGRGGAINGTFS